MNRVNSPLIASLVDDLAPVRPLKRGYGIALVAVATATTVVGVALLEGLWMGAARADAPFFVANLLLLVLGTAAAASVVSMASPRVGNQHEAPRMGVAMAATVPAAAIITALMGDGLSVIARDPYGLTCALASLASAVVVAAALLLWLRRGAPVSLHAAGTHLGIAATALGSAAYGLSCPLDHIGHLGIWHFAPVAVGALVGRLAVPPLLRW